MNSRLKDLKIERRTVLLVGAAAAGLTLVGGAAPAFASERQITPVDAPVGVPSFDAASQITDIPAPPSYWTAAEQQNAQVWLEQQLAIAERMHGSGFQYRFTPYWLYPDDYDFTAAPSDDRGSKRMLALQGTKVRSKGAYDWRQAGHQGAVVHATGLDHAN